MDEKDRTISSLEKEVAYLKRLLDANHIEYEMPASFDLPHVPFSSSEEKAALIRDYFRGREDVYASCRITKDGKKQIYPVCSHRAHGRYCPHFGPHGCQGCDKREYAKLDNATILEHLKGQSIIGVYPLLADDSCFFLAVDFDKEGFRQAANAYRKAANSNGLSCLVELSQSGNGAHVFLFFATAIKAYKARQLGTLLLDEAMEDSSSVGFSAYDRMFPSQDYLPKKDGLGNLILLPLQGEVKTKEGKTAFVDINFIPYPLKDQLSVLASTQKIFEAEIDFILKKGKQMNRGSFGSKLLQKRLPLSKNDFPQTLIIENKGELTLSKVGMSLMAAKYISRLASVPNPIYFERQRKRMPLFAYGKALVSRFIVLTHEDETLISIPRGCRKDLLNLLSAYQVNVLEKDLRYRGEAIDTTFKGILRPDQKEAMEALLKQDNGMIVAATSFGKTVLGIATIAQLKLNTLIIVPRLSLLKQWHEKLTQFLEIEPTLIGKRKITFGEYSGSRKKLTYKVDVASIESLQGDKAKEELGKYGLVLIDEAHHIGARTYEDVLRNISSRYLYTLTATNKRSDGLQSLFPLLIGEVLFDKEAENDRSVLRRLIPRFTKFSLQSLDKNMPYADIVTALIRDKDRNAMIVKDLENAYQSGSHVLLLSERLEHLELLKNQVGVPAKDIYVLTGSTEKKEKERVLAAISKDNPFVLLATGSYVGEGFDEPNLDTLFMASPFKWRYRLTQYVGRIHRRKEGKNTVTVYDYIDIKAFMFVRMYQERLRGYKREGYVLAGEETLVKRLYSADTYKEALDEDLSKARKEVVFFVSYFDKLAIEELANKGLLPVQIYTFVDIETTNEKQVVHKLSVPTANMIIIDSEILYFGEINPFLRENQKGTSMMRIEDKALCSEILKEAKSET